ncbi:glutaredoxin family protein [Corynebacterium kroppenstedtii]|uniref:glutaredoxin family protein n=1 Tax=Corynebacterium sp. PCR 32 TaxID=3351342 RepID=UPI0030A1EFA6
MHQVELMVRQSCGSCQRVAAQIHPICQQWGAELRVVDVDSVPGLAMEFGDRVPVVLVDDEEIACWEVDDDDLIAALRR